VASTRAAFNAAGDPKCSFDYTNPDASLSGPNCCTGEYSLETRSWDVELNAGAGGYKPNPPQTVKWGGQFSNCLAGPAMKSQPKDSSGYPYALDYYTLAAGKNEIYTVDQLSSSGGAPNLRSSVYAANFFNIADHGAALPPPLNTQDGVSGSAPNPYYNFYCLDRADEIVAKIRIMVRDWNRLSDHTTYSAGGAEATLEAASNFNTGTEPINDDYAPDLYNDYKDWLDFGLTYPGRNQ
jgi:hypothetical protein